MNSLNINKPVEWEGHFVALADTTISDKITLSKGSTLFLGIPKIEKEVKCDGMKFLLEDVKEVKDKVTIKSASVGSILNCKDFDSLECSEDVKLRISDSEIKKTLKVEKGCGEIIRSEIKGKTTLKESTFYTYKSKFQTLETNDVILSGASVSAQQIDMTKTSLQARSFVANISVSSDSSLISYESQLSVSSQGSVLATGKEISIAVNNKGFIGIGCVGSSNFSQIKGGVDILAVPRINNRTSNNFVVGAGQDIILNAGSSAYMVAGSKLLCQSGSDMNLVSKATQLLKGSKVYVVGSSVPSFTPTDNCTADGCSKPVWVSGGTGQSVKSPGLD